MAQETVPPTLSVPLNSLVNLAVEWWRLSTAAKEQASAPARDAMRKIEDFLHQCDLEVQSLDGRAFDPGLALRVIDAVDDPGVPRGQTVIEQTLSPMVLWRGQVVKVADVATRRGVS